jgi:hypothetical protein
MKRYSSWIKFFIAIKNQKYYSHKIIQTKGFAKPVISIDAGIVWVKEKEKSSI